MKRGKSYFYASNNHCGITANLCGQTHKLYRFSFRVSRDKFVAEDPKYREAVPGRSPIVRYVKRLEQTQQIYWPFEYED
jgi:hypothetical protein